jgi:hypothetical protein
VDVPVPNYGLTFQAQVCGIPHDLSLHPLSKSANYRKHLKQLIELYVKTKQEWYVSEAILGGCRVRRHDD